MKAREAREYYNDCENYDEVMSTEGWFVPGRVARALLSHARFAGGENVLDVGCGTGLVGQALRRHGFNGRLMGVDIAEKRLAQARATGAYNLTRTADAYHLPWSFSPYDGVVSSAMLGLAGPKAFNEMLRVLRPDGILSVSAGFIKDEDDTFERFHAVQRRMDTLRGLKHVELIFSKDLGNGYTNPERQGEHYHLYVFRKLRRSE